MREVSQTLVSLAIHVYFQAACSLQTPEHCLQPHHRGSSEGVSHGSTNWPVEREGGDDDSTYQHWTEDQK